MLRDRKTAIAEFFTGLSNNPKNAEAYHRIARLQAGDGNPEALKNFDNAIALDPNQSAYYYNKADAVLRLDSNNKESAKRTAISLMDRSIELEPEFAGGYHTRGQLYEQLGNMQKARRDYEKAVKLFPKKSPFFKKDVICPYHADLDRVVKRLEK